MVDELNTDINHVNNASYIFVGRKENAKDLLMTWEHPNKVNWSKYQIKETDMRQKTMTFTSPQYFDLTDGQFVVLLVSALHENFGGIILSVDYDESTGLYDYKCQDYSRSYQRKYEYIGKPVSNHRFLMKWITHSAIESTGKLDKYVLAEWNKNLAGLRPAKDYDNSIWNNYIKGNPMNATAQRIIRDKSAIEIIRSICFGEIGFVDVYFDEYGYVNIEPFNHTEWENRGLHLSTSEVINRKFGFDTTNIITRVIVNGSGMEGGYVLDSADLLGLDLAAFFGTQSTSISSNKTSETTNTTTKTTKTTKKSSTNDKKTKYANNMGTKKKQVWLSADGGTPRSVLNGIAKKLQKYGWTTHVNNNIGAGAHSSDIYKVKNGVYSPIYNGACAMTIKELWDGGAYKDAVRRGGVLAPIWWTSVWTDPHGMKPYRYSLENMKRLEKAWDDPSNYCPILYNPGKQMTKRNIRYCCAPTVSEIVAQFLMGGAVESQKNTNTTKKKK